MKIKFNTDDNILLNNIIYFPAITIIITYPQLFLDECLYEV